MYSSNFIERNDRMKNLIGADKNHTFTTAAQEVWRARIRAELSSVNQWRQTWDFLIDSRECEAPTAFRNPSCQSEAKKFDPSDARLKVKVSSDNPLFSKPQ